MEQVKLDLEFVRGRFPALADGYTFFDNAGGSQTLRSVVERISEFLLTSDVQLGASYEVSQTAGERVDRAVANLATFVNAATPDEIVFGPSTSMLIKILAWTLGRSLTVGDEIIVCHANHEANIGPWVELEAEGIVIKRWSPDPQTLALDLTELEALHSSRTRLVAVNDISNVLGTINPIAAISEMAHRHGALVCVDGVAAAPHRAIDVRALDVDFYAFSCYKVFGPHAAVLYARKSLLDALPGINHYFIKDGAYKLLPGNLNFELVWGTTGVLDYFRELVAHHFPGDRASDRQCITRAYDLFARHEQVLAARLLEFLCNRPSVRIIGERSADRQLRVGTISFVVDGMDSREVTLATDPHRIGIRYGDFYAKRLIEELGLAGQNGVVRVSMVHYNTLDEVDRLVEILDRCLP